MCDALLEHGLPEPDEAQDPRQYPPRSLLEYVFGKMGENAKGLGELQRTLLIVKWTRTIGALGLVFTDVDATHGEMAAKLHQSAVQFSKEQNTLEKLSKDLDRNISIITSLADKKRKDITNIQDPELFKQQLMKIDTWAMEKMDEKKNFVIQETNRVYQLQLDFAQHLEELLDAIEAQHYSRFANDDVTLDLEAQLQALMLEAHGADSGAGAGHITPPRQGHEPLLAVKDEVTRVQGVCYVLIDFFV